MMVTRRQSFLFSLGVHAVIVIALLITGVILARRPLKFTTMELDLLAPVQAGVEENGAVEEEPEPEPEPEPEIVEREREDPTFDPKRTFDPSKIPEIEREEVKPYTPKRVSVEGVDSTRAGTNYGSLVIAVCKKTWSPPAEGVLGRPVPSTVVVITVRRDGRILGQRIVKASGNAELDGSVLEAVRLSDPLPAFPRELTGAQREFRVRFIPED